MKRASKGKKSSATNVASASGPRPPPVRPDRTVLICALLFLITLAAFLPALKGGFVDFDDPTYVSANAHVNRGLTWGGIKWAFTSMETSNWHPLTWLSHMLDCQWFGLKTWGHHLTSVLLHALNTVLLFLVLKRMSGVVWRSLFVAAIFGLHPLRVESVAWISERKDVLSTCFWLLAWWAYVRFVEESRMEKGKPKLYYALTAVFFALGLMSKPMLVTFPCTLLLLDYWPLRRKLPWPRLVMEKVPFFVLAAAASAVTVIAQKSVGAVATVNQFSPGSRVGNALVSYGRYLGKLLWPVNLSILYPHPAHWPDVAVVASALLLLAITVFAVAMRHTRPYLIVGWLWFLGTLVPTIGLVQVGSQAMADRYSYVPTIGILIMLTWLVCDLTARWPRQSVALPIAAAVAIALCGIVTEIQIGYWHDNETLFRRATVATEDNFIAYNSLGAALYDKKHYDEATAAYRASVKLYPGYSDARNNLIVVLIRTGRLDEAIYQLNEAKNFHLDYPNLRYSLGAALKDRGRLDDAIVQFNDALALKPDFAPSQAGLGDALLRKGRADEAITHLQAALRLRPEDAEAQCNLGIALAGKGRMDDALVHFEAAVKQQSDSAGPHNWLGSALVEQGRIDEGIAQLREAVKISPDFADAHNNLGTALLRKGLLDDAIQQYQTALKLRPDYSDARTNLRTALAKKNSPAKP